MFEGFRQRRQERRRLQEAYQRVSEFLEDAGRAVKDGSCIPVGDPTSVRENTFQLMFHGKKIVVRLPEGNGDPEELSIDGVAIDVHACGAYGLAYAVRQRPALEAKRKQEREQQKWHQNFLQLAEDLPATHTNGKKSGAVTLADMDGVGSVTLVPENK
jgi:hypothetical protein